MRLFALALLFSSGLFAVVSTNPSEAQIETIVNKFAAKEAEFERMCDEMAVHMRNLTRQEMSRGRMATNKYEPERMMEIPTWAS